MPSQASPPISEPLNTIGFTPKLSSIASKYGNNNNNNEVSTNGHNTTLNQTAATNEVGVSHNHHSSDSNHHNHHHNHNHNHNHNHHNHHHMFKNKSKLHPNNSQQQHLHNHLVQKQQNFKLPRLPRFVQKPFTMFKGSIPNPMMRVNHHNNNTNGCGGDLVVGGDLNTHQPQSPLAARQTLRERLRDLRDKVRAEDLALQNSVATDQHKAKDEIGGWALTPEQMHHLKVTPYEYNASAGSVLELLVMQRFWIWLAKFVPMCISPCTITAIGFMINLCTSVILISYSPDAKAEVPRWSLLLAALGVFLYQIADALDGKQSYKLQNTQLEEFYDHACDSVSTILLVYSIAITTQCGHYPALLLSILFGGLLAFYSTHWQCYVTNQMVFGKIDVTEGQWSMIVIHLCAAIYGQSFWSATKLTIPLLGYTVTLTQLLAMLSLASLINCILSNANIVLGGVRTPLDIAGCVIPRRQSGQWRPLVPVCIATTLLWLAYTCGYFHLNNMMFVLLFGFTYSKLTMKLVMAHCTNSTSELWDNALIAPTLLVLDSILCRLVPLPLPLSSIDPSKALLCALCCNTVELVRYFTCISWDLCVALEVYIFAIRYPPGHAKNRRDCGGYYINGLNNDQVLNNSVTTTTTTTTVAQQQSVGGKGDDNEEDN